MSKVVCEQIEFSAEQSSDPGNPAANKMVMFTKDDGTGKTVLGLRFANGSTMSLATQGRTNRPATQTFRGLYFRNHPDSDSLATKLMLVKADEIVLSDGDQVVPTERLVLDKAVTGSVGGMQAAAANSSWNKAYYIRKSANGADGLWGVRAKDYFLDQTQATQDTNGTGLRSAASNTKQAQGFQVATAGKLEFVDVSVLKAASPTGNIWFTIESDSAGSPSGTVLATSDKYDVARLTTTGTVVRFPFRSPATLSTSTQYHLVWQGDFTISGTNYAIWQYKNTTNPYANGSAKEFDGATWNAHGTTADFYFKIYITRNDTAISPPSGYDQYAHIGWFYIDGSGNIKYFSAVDRNISVGGSSWKVGTNAATTPTLTDIAAFIPPIPVRITFGIATSNATGAGQLGRITATDGTGTISDRTDALSFNSTPSTTVTGMTIATIPMMFDYQALMWITDGGTNHIWIKEITW